MASEAVLVLKQERRKSREDRAWEREKILYEKVLTPDLVRILLVAAIISYSTWATRSKTNVGPVGSALALAGPGIGIPLIAAGAGIKDKYALAAISAAGLGYAGLSMFKGWEDMGILNLGGSGSIWDQIFAVPHTITDEITGIWNWIT